ncbi:MAG: zinc ribbon domain-containing protein, partial [Polyangiales bacterium]
MVPSVREQMDVLKELVVADEEIRKLDAELAKEREALDGVKRDLERVRGTIERGRTQYEEIDTARNASVHEARVMQQQLERSREKLGRARNEKESNAVQREIEEMRKLLRDVEDSIGKRVLDLEALKKSVLDHEDEETKLVARITETEGAVAEKVGTLEGLRGERNGIRDGIAKKLPVATLKKYDLIRSKRGSGAARMDKGRCATCNMQIPPQIAQKIQRIDVLEQCPSCNRFLWVEPTPSLA